MVVLGLVEENLVCVYMGVVGIGYFVQREM